MYDSAISYYNQCLHISPNYYIAMSNLGCSYLKKKNYDTAISWFNKCL